jgi:hypothetical protein
MLEVLSKSTSVPSPPHCRVHYVLRKSFELNSFQLVTVSRNLLPISLSFSLFLSLSLLPILYSPNHLFCLALFFFPLQALTHSTTIFPSCLIILSFLFRERTLPSSRVCLSPLVDLPSLHLGHRLANPAPGLSTMHDS